jgi:hypothetical protein
MEAAPAISCKSGMPEVAGFTKVFAGAKFAVPPLVVL